MDFFKLARINGIFLNRLTRAITLFVFFFYMVTIEAQVTIEAISSPHPDELFLNVENPILIGVVNLNTKKIDVTITKGTINGNNGKYYAKPLDGSKDATIEVFLEGRSIGKRKFKVLRVPDPMVCYANVCGDNIEVSMSQIASPLLLDIKGFQFDKYAEVVSFDLTLFENGTKKRMSSTNAYLTESMKDCIKSSGRGQQIIISEIKCKMPFGEIRNLKSVNVTIK